MVGEWKGRGGGGRNWRKADYDGTGMRAEIGEIQWETELAGKNVEESWTMFSR